MVIPPTDSVKFPSRLLERLHDNGFRVAEASVGYDGRSGTLEFFTDKESDVFANVVDIVYADLKGKLYQRESKTIRFPLDSIYNFVEALSYIRSGFPVNETTARIMNRKIQGTEVRPIDFEIR